MSTGIDKNRALSFGKSAKLYDDFRPRYPENWTEDLRKKTKTNSKSSILEVGTGTGIATKDLIRLSNRITCLDPDENMLALAHNKFPNPTYVMSTFEDFVTNNTFDLIVSATAWHWVDPSIGYNKAHDLLNKQGHLAIIRYYHVDADPESFHNRAQYIYEKYNETTVTKRHVEQVKRIQQDAELLDNELFQLVEQKEYASERDYSIADYLALRNTYSDHLTMSREQRDKMEKELIDFADAEFGGRIRKKYTTVLFIGLRR